MADQPDWVALGRLRQLPLSRDDVELIWAVQLGLIPPRVAVTPAGRMAAADDRQVVLCDTQSTPLALAESVDAGWQLTTLRPIDSSAQLPTRWAGPIVVVDGPLFERVAQLPGPVLWLVPAAATAEGHALVARVRALATSEEPVIRFPAPAGGGEALLMADWPQVDQLAHAVGATEVIHAGTPRSAVDRGGTVIFFTGLSGSGKSTLATALMAELAGLTERPLTLLDGDEVRQMLSAELGFDAAGREANIRRIAWVAALAARHGGIAVAAPIAPFAAGREEARRMALECGDFLLVWVATDLATCEQRDRKGLYARARAGQVAEFTGISSPYQEPADADLIIDTTTTTVEEGVARIVAELRRRQRLEGW